MIAMPVAEPRAAAPPAPSTAPAPAATKGAASPPVTPGKGRKKLLSANICKVKRFSDKYKNSKIELLKARGELIQNANFVHYFDYLNTLR